MSKLKAEHSKEGHRRVTRQGWIADPMKDFIDTTGRMMTYIEGLQGIIMHEIGADRLKTLAATIPSSPATQPESQPDKQERK